MEDGGQVDPESKIRLVVPNSSCGGIIGKGGAIIRSAYSLISLLSHTFPDLCFSKYVNKKMQMHVRSFMCSFGCMSKIVNL